MYSYWLRLGTWLLLLHPKTKTGPTYQACVKPFFFSGFQNHMRVSSIVAVANVGLLLLCCGVVPDKKNAANYVQLQHKPYRVYTYDMILLISILYHRYDTRGRRVFESSAHRQLKGYLVQTTRRRHSRDWRQPGWCLARLHSWWLNHGDGNHDQMPYSTLFIQNKSNQASMIKVWYMNTTGSSTPYLLRNRFAPTFFCGQDPNIEKTRQLWDRASIETHILHSVSYMMHMQAACDVSIARAPPC